MLGARLFLALVLCSWTADGFSLTFDNKLNRPPVGASSVLAAAASSSSNEVTSTITDQKVIDAAKYFMNHGGYFNPLDAEILAEDFVFRGPVIGPLNKQDYIEVLKYFGIYKAFPDIDPNCFGFTVDPEDPLRVWFQVRATGTYQNPIGGPLGNVLKPDNREYRGSVETWSLLFDKDLKVQLVTAGYVVDRFDDKATTNGAGLSFGILSTLGLSFPSASGDPRLRAIQGVAALLEGSGLAPTAVSAPEKVPSWWKNEKRGADP